MLHLETESFHDSFWTRKYCFNYRSSATEVFVEKGVLQILAEFQGEHSKRSMAVSMKYKIANKLI